MRKTLVSLLLGANMLYTGCISHYSEYNVDGNSVDFRKEAKPLFGSQWDLVERKKDSTTTIYYDFVDDLSRSKSDHLFSVDSYTYYNDSSKVGRALENRLHYLLQKIDSIDNARDEELIRKINE